MFHCLPLTVNLSKVYRSNNQSLHIIQNLFDVFGVKVIENRLFLLNYLPREALIYIYLNIKTLFRSYGLTFEMQPRVEEGK